MNATTLTTFTAAALTALLYFGKPTEEQQPVEQIALTPAACDCESCDCDIDAVIERVANIEATVQQHAAELAEIEKCHAEDIAELRKSITTTLAEKPAPLPAPTPAPVKIATTPVVKQSLTPAATYNPRWQNFDGKDRMRHAAEDHGIDVSRYSQAQVLRMMDADHDRFGGNGHAAIKASRSIAVAPVTYSQSTYRAPLRSYSTQTYSNCPGGVCPVPQAQPVRRGLLGWRR